MEMTKSEKLLNKKKKMKKKIGGIFFDMASAKKGRGFQGFPNPYFQQFSKTAFKQSGNQTLKISSQFS